MWWNFWCLLPKPCAQYQALVPRGYLKLSSDVHSLFFFKILLSLVVSVSPYSILCGCLHTSVCLPVLTCMHPCAHTCGSHRWTLNVLLTLSPSYVFEIRAFGKAGAHEFTRLAGQQASLRCLYIPSTETATGTGDPDSRSSLLHN